MDLDELPDVTVVLLLLGHAAIAVLLLLDALAPPKLRTLTLRVAAGAGIVLSLGLAIAGRGSPEWRGFILDADRSLVAGTASACAWLLVGARARLLPRVERGALVGAGASGLALLAAGRWLVPSLLFALVVGAAAVVLLLEGRRRSYAWFGVAAGLAIATAAFTVWWLDAELWELPLAVEGWEKWLVVAAAGLLAGGLPLTGAWAQGAARGSEAAPLLVGAGFLLLLRPAAGEQPWVAASLVVLATAAYAWCAVKERKIGTVTACPILVALAVSFVAPSMVPAIAVASLLATTVLLLMPAARPTAPVLLFTHLPLTAGFGAVVVAGEVAFRRAVDAGEVIDAVPWSVVVVVLPAMVGASLLLARRLILRGAGGPIHSDARVATWLIAGASLALALFPEALLIGDGLPSREILLFGGASLLGLLTAVIVRRRAGSDVSVPLPDEPLASPPAGPRFARTVAAAAALFSLIAVAGAAYLLVEGLKLGFL
ncbi:MAG: hypothetical protein QOH26_485 [Actinomycetota bacterium]|nr:hypothetical protein [Actinomycetota bacterium]